MQQQPRTVFISSSRDMTEWAALGAATVRDFAERHGLADLHIVDYRDIDPAALDHGLTWQDSVGAPSRMETVLTLVLLGERVGTPLPATFRLKHDIHARLQAAGHDWVHVAGMTPGELRPDQVPLTGVLFEYFDAFLPRRDGSEPGPLRVVLKGVADDGAEPDFGNGEFRAQIEVMAETAQRKRQLRKEYDQQLDWMNLFWGKLYGLQQHASVVCRDQPAFVEQLERILAAEFLAGDRRLAGSASRRIDARQVELPGPAPYDIERASFFLGRGPQVAELARRAMSHQAPRRLVPLCGESGAGKSSLLRAGLLNDARSPARRRLGWRAAFISLAERPLGRSPLLFLADALADPLVLPELGGSEALCQRLDGLPPMAAARRLLDILAEIAPVHPPGLGRPRLLLVVDQLELAIDGARLDVPEAAAWAAFLQVVAALGDALLDPAMRDALAGAAERVAAVLPVSVVVGLPADRFNAFAAVMQPGNHVFPLPRVVDETALREIIVGTFSALGLEVEPAAQEVLCREAATLAIGTEASILPLLAVTLAALHDDWKQRAGIEARWHARQHRAGAELPYGLVVAGISPNGRAGADIKLDHIRRDGQLAQAFERQGERAWSKAEDDETGIKLSLRHLPISQSRQKAESGDITGRDFALARLLRRLVAVSADDAVPDRLTGLPDDGLDSVARPLAEALRHHRLLTRHDDGAWWLVHQAVLKGWARAAQWRETEKQNFRTLAAMDMDRRRWQEEEAAGEPDASRWLWTRSRQIDQAMAWLNVHGQGDNPVLATFVKESVIAAVRQGSAPAAFALVWAAYFDDLDWAKAILSVAGTGDAEVRYPGGRSASALSNACGRGNTELVRLLLRDGADPDGALDTGWSPLMSAALAGYGEICNDLLAAGARTGNANSGGFTALMASAHNGHDVVARRLIAAGAAVDHQADNGATALTVAAERGHDAVLALLLAAGASVGHADNGGRTALHYSAGQGDELVVRRLVLAGAAVDLPAGNGATPLHWATAKGHDTVVDLLLAAGANAGHADIDGATPMWLAAEAGHAAVLARLIAAVEATPAALGQVLIPAARNGHDMAVAALIAAGAAIDQPDKQGRTALMAAVDSAHEGVASRLLAAGANGNLADEKGDTALMGAARLKDEGLARLLVDHGADPSARNQAGRSALEIAYKQDAKPVVDVLVASGMAPLSDDEVERLPGSGSVSMTIGVVVNARGKLCLVHDFKFKAVPLWVGYHVDKIQIEIFFDEGSSFPISWEEADEMTKYLESSNQILIIRMLNRKPVEGYYTSLVRLRDGIVFDDF